MRDMKPKEMQLDANRLWAAFDHSIEQEVKKTHSTIHKTEYIWNWVMSLSELNLVLSSLKRDLDLREARYQASEVEEIPKVEVEQPKVEVSATLSKDIEILEDEEKQRVLDDEYTSVDGKIALKLRSTADETQVVVIRMGMVWECLWSKL